MNVKQAGGEIRKLHVVFKAFQHIEEVLDAAADAERAQTTLMGQIEALRAEKGELVELVKVNRGVFTEEQTAAQVEMEHLNEAHQKAEARLRAEAEAKAVSREKEAKSAEEAGKLMAEHHKAVNAELRAEKALLEEALALASSEYAALLDRIGVRG